MMLKINRAALTFHAIHAAATLACVAVALVYALAVMSPFYWETVVHLVLRMPYPLSYALAAQAVVSGASVAAIALYWGSARNAGYRTELPLLMVLSLTIFLSALYDIFLKPVLWNLF
jgi:hypothetical protein